jgi:hypothetical protein
MTKVNEADVTYVEDIEDGRASAKDGSDKKKKKVMGTVKLTEGKVVYIPTPTADPQGMNTSFTVWTTRADGTCRADPLNMVLWQKWVVLVVISICSYPKGGFFMLIC